MRSLATSRSVRSAVAALVVVLLAALVVVPAARVDAQSASPSIPPPASFLVELTATGFVPDRITVSPGQTIDVVNATGAVRTITSGGDGTFDSGPVAPGSRFVLALPTTGTWVAVDDTTPAAHRAVITVGLAGLAGAASAPANGAITDLDPPDAQALIHPDLGIEVTDNRILVSFLDTATVAQANAALAAARLTIVGSNRDLRLLVTEVADPGTPGLDHVQTALDIVRAQPGVRTAAYDISLSEAALPRPVNPDPFPDPTTGDPTYTWEAVVSADDTIRGVGNNYGLESARFPQAWNWLDALRRIRPVNRASSATVVLDAGFDPGHPDIATATLHQLCTSAGRCTTNPTGFDNSGRSRGTHGTAVAGVVGAVFDVGSPINFNSLGTVGGDPMSDLHLVPYLNDNRVNATGTVGYFSFASSIDLILDSKAADFPNLRVVNLSAGIYFPEIIKGFSVFEQRYNSIRCGPGDDDDLTAPLSQRVACTPNSLDIYISEFRAAAELLRPITARLAAENVLLVVAAGNDSDLFCTQPRSTGATPCTSFVPLSANTGDTFGHLVATAGAAVLPVVLVEGNDATPAALQRSAFSNVDGQISAAGDVVAPAVRGPAPGTPGYIKITGTSFSAPLVSAAAGLLSSLTPNWQTVRSLLVDRATADVPGSPTPRLDVFASLLGLPAANGIDALLDVNDNSADGNRRVTYDDRGQPTGEDRVLGNQQSRTRWSAPDGRVDMRDFRRYRDARLDLCAGNNFSGCLPSFEISIDGSPTHPKRDLNLDRCFGSQNVPQCPNNEGTFARVDFNGDGTLLQREFPILLNPDGTPAARGAGSRMTDLDVFQTRFGKQPGADTEGWEADDLDRLMSSADIELRLDRIFAQGATSIEVTASTFAETGPTRTFTPQGPGYVRTYTVPVVPTVDLGNTDTLQVRVVAELPGGDTAVYLSDPLSAKAGQDLVLTPCIDQLVAEAAPPETTPGGSSTITARLQDCEGRPLAGRDVEFDYTGPDGSSLSVLSGVTDSTGTVRTVFTYPEGVNSPAQVIARATPAIDGGERLQRTVAIGPADDFVIHYRFRQTILDYQRTSTNDWGPGQDDCDGPTDAGISPSWCFVSDQTIDTEALGTRFDDDGVVIGTFTYEVELGELERTGTITPNTSGGATIDDSARVVQRSKSAEPGAGDRDGITLGTGVIEWDPLAPDDVLEAGYRSFIGISGQPRADEFADLPPLDVPTIDFAVTDERIRVNNLRQYGDNYAPRQSLSTTQPGQLILPDLTNPDLPIPNPYQPLRQIPTDIALIPRADSSSFAWDWNPDAPLDFTANPDGSFRPTSWCGTRERVFDNTESPGFWNDDDPAIETINPLDPNEIVVGPYRDPDQQRTQRGPSDRAAPRHTGSVTSRFEFVAVVTRAGDPVPDLEFPTCIDSDALPFFAWQPGAPVEGEEVNFIDLSSYADNAQSTQWRFADPLAPDTSITPTHTFSDNGTYPVGFTVTDAEGTAHTSNTADVVVVNAPPVLDDVEFLDGGRRIRFTVDDPGLVDRQQLTVKLTSPTPGWPNNVVTYASPPIDPSTGVLASGPWTDTITLPDDLAPGAYFVVLTVSDKDGGTATRTFSLGVPVPIPGGPSGFRSPGRPAGVSTSLPEFSVPALLAQGLTAQATTPAVPAVTSPPPAAPVPAFVVDRTTLTTGSLVEVRNRTRTAGVPTAADLDPGDGRPPLRVPADGAVQLTYGAAGAPALRVTAGAIGAATALSVTGSPIPAAVVYEGPTTAPLGADAAVVARVTQVGDISLVGAVVRFTLGDVSVQAVTGSDGRARADLSVTGAAGPRELTVQVVPSGDPSTVGFTVTPNAVPVADAGGPYSFGVGSPLTLAGSATDADAGEQALLAYQWDLDGDGAFDDATGPAPSLTPDQVRVLLCGGTCDAGESATVALRATDVKGGRSIDTATATAIRDFGLTINPSSRILGPNTSATFTVSVLSTNGFTGPVTLSAPGLPSGVTATFTPSTVTPNGTSLLDLRAGPSVSGSGFPVLVRGTSGSIVRETGSSVSLDFGLIPECFGAVTGRVTDQNGLGVAGVTVLGATTNSTGVYSATNLRLDPGNAPRQVSVANLNNSSFYPFPTPPQVTISCGVTNTLDLAVVRRQFGAVSGVITGIAADGAPLGPIDGATFALNRFTDESGEYSLTNLPLDPFNVPTSYRVDASAPGFQPASRSTQISAGTTSTLDLALREICRASVRVRVLDQATGRAVPGARVDTGQGSLVRLTDANGIALVENLALGAPDNRPITRSFRARTPAGVAPEGVSPFTNVTIGRCGAVVPVDIAVPFPRRVEAPMTVRVIDDTGAPVQGATIQIAPAAGGAGTNYSQPTGTDGRVTVTHLLGIDVPPTLEVAVRAFRSGLLSPVGVRVTLTDRQPASVTVTLVRPRFGVVEGTVRDRATGAPIAGVTVNGVTTGPDGRYRRENLPLSGINEPANVQVTARDGRTPRQFWDSVTEFVTVRADEVTQVPDLLMTRVCQPATIRGRVVIAGTNTGIEGARVGVSSTLFTLTDADGRFVLSNLPLGTNNANAPYGVTASAATFLPATKLVTVSCGADVVVDFGRDGDGAGTISGRVTDLDGNPVPLAQVTTGFGGSAVTSSNGEYTIVNAPAGLGGAARDWMVRVQPRAPSVLEPAEATVSVRRDETTTRNFQLGTLADDPPTAASFSLTIDAVATPITLAGADPTGDPLTFEVTVPPTNGALTGTPPNLTYTPNTGFAGVDTITYVADDGPNTSPPGVVTITVRGPNQLPVARITGPPPATGEIVVDEGTRVDLSGSTSSDPDGSITRYDWDLDEDGAFDDRTGATADVRREDDAVVVVGLQVTDDRGGVSTTTRSVRFRNVAPTLDLDPPDVTARSIEVSGDVDDDGRDDTFTGTVDLGDGSGVRPLTSAELDGDDLFVEHTYPGGGTFTITVRICDDDGGCVTENTTATIDGPGNASPIARITGPTTAPEGETIELSAATSSDPDGVIASAAWDLDGDGVYDDATGTTASLSRDDDAVIDVGVRVLDGAGAAGTRRATVTFTNVVPVVAAIADPSVVAGGAISIPGSFDDPGADGWTAEVVWDDGQTDQLTLTGRTFTVARTFPDAGSYPATVEVCDDDDGCGSVSFTVTVTAVNVAPTAVIDAPASTPEGSSAPLDGTGSDDPDGTPITYAWDLDDDGSFDDATTATTSFPCLDDGASTVRLRVRDGDDATGEASATVTCTNVAPTVPAITGAALAPGQAFQRAGSFADPGTDAWTATVNWGEGAGPTPLALVGTEFTLDHVFENTGTFIVTVVVRDDDGGVGLTTAEVVVAEPVSDPEVDLSITKSHDADLVAGADAAYTVTVTNAGPDAALGVTVTDELPNGLRFLGTVSSGWSCSDAGSAPVVCALSGGLAARSTAQLVLDVAVAADAPIGVGVVTNRATVSTTSRDVDDEDNVALDPTTILAPPAPESDLDASVEFSDTEPEPGEAVTMTIVVANAGPDSSGAVTATVDVPEGLSFIGVVGPQGFRLRQSSGTWTCTPGDPLVCIGPDIPANASSLLALRFVLDTTAAGVLEGSVGVTSATDPSGSTVSIELAVAQQQSTTTTTSTTSTTTTTTSTTAPPAAGPTTTVGTTLPRAVGGPVPTATTSAPSPFGDQRPSAIGTAIPADVQLPSTGSDSPRLSTLALQLLVAGGVLWLLGRGSRRSASRHDRSGRS